MSKKYKKTRHLIDYDTLQDWGFQIYKSIDNFCVSYFSIHGNKSIFGDNTIFIDFILRTKFGVNWEIYYFYDDKRNTIFNGYINNNSQLEEILKTVVVFKPKEKFKHYCFKCTTVNIFDENILKYLGAYNESRIELYDVPDNPEILKEITYQLKKNTIKYKIYTLKTGKGFFNIYISKIKFE